MDQGQWVNGMLNMARISVETGLRSMDTFQKQAEKAIELTVNNTDLVQDESRKALSGWMDNVKKSHQVYVDAIEEGLSNLEKHFSRDTPMKKK